MKLHHYAILGFLLGIPSARAAEAKPPLAPEILAAAVRGEAAARFQLARACLRGDGVPKDVNKAFALMQESAEQGYADAMGGLGYFYSVGVAVAKDENLAAEWFRKGAAKGSAKARLNLGKMLLAGKGGSGGSPEKLGEEGLQWVRKAAEQGLPEAALAYGSMLYFGDHGAAQDYGKAAPFLQLAAGQGLPDAQNFYGTMNELGLGMPVDAVAAAAWFRKAALQGHVKAQSNLGRVLGPLVENKATRIESLAWLIIASGRGEVTADKTLQDAAPGLQEGEFDEAKKQAVELRKLVR